MKKHLTMSELDALGFEVVRSYPHDDFVTQRRRKGNITLETTWEMPSGKFVSQYLTIGDYFLSDFNEKDLSDLDRIINK